VVLLSTFTSVEPSILVQYLLELQKNLASCTYVLRVKDMPVDVGRARLSVLLKAKEVLVIGIRVLGAEEVEYM
jgi:arginyl-tRNA synthetase